jgi:hypothetical protein
MNEFAKRMEWLGRLPWRMIGWSLVVVLLLLPLVAMQLTPEVVWTASDFLFAAILLGGTGLLIELAVRRLPLMGYRLAAIAVILVTLLVVWASLAVATIAPQTLV